MIIIDVGAANSNLKKQPGKVYVMFEPDPDSFQELELKHAGDPSIYILNKGLWNQDTNTTLYLTKKRECSSLYKPNMTMIKILKNVFSNKDVDRFEIEEELEIPVVRMDTVLEQVFEDLTNKGHSKESISIDRVKVDTQGSEYEILQGMGKYLDIVMEVEVEVEFVELYHNQKLFKDIDDFLSSKGFQFSHFLREVLFNGVTAFGDAVYVRNNLA